MIPPRPPSWWPPTLLLAVVAWTVVYGADIAIVFYDQMHNWRLALEPLKAGELPRRGANISGFGPNGPFYHILLQLGLRAYHTEAGMALYCASLAAAGLLATTAIAALRWGWATAAWIAAIVMSQPLLMEWSRINLDFSYTPVWMAVALSVWLLLRRWPQRWWLWLLWGLCCGGGLHLHVTLGPLLLVASWWAWRPSRQWLAPVLTVAGVTLTYATVIGEVREFKMPLDWEGMLGTSATMLKVAAASTAARGAAIGVPGWVAAAGTVLPWIAAAVGALWAGRGARRLLVAAAACLAFVSFSEASHYHHLMHIDTFVMTGIAAGAAVLLRWRAGRVVLGALVIANLAVAHAAIVDARERGWVPTPSSFPLAWPGVTEQIATAGQRDAVYAALRSSGLHSLDARQAVTGAVLPYADHRWQFLPDLIHGAPAPTSDAVGRWWLHQDACALGGRPAGSFCLVQTATDPPPQTVVSLPANAVDRARRQYALEAEIARTPNPFPVEFPTLRAVRGIHFPLAVTAEGRPLVGLDLQSLRFPDAMDSFGHLPLRVEGARLAATDHTMLLVQRRWLFERPVTEVILTTTEEQRFHVFRVVPIDASAP